MDILVIAILIFAIVLLVLVVANVPVSQKALNILFLLMIVLLCVNGAGWIHIRG
jgi:hypothetical protein